MGGGLGRVWKCTAHNFFVGIHLQFQRVLYVPPAPSASLLPRGRGMGTEKGTDPHNAFAKDTGVTPDRRATIQDFVLLLPPKTFSHLLLTAGCFVSCFSPPPQPSVSFGHPTALASPPRTLHIPVLNLTMFLPAHFCSLSRSFQMMAPTSGISPTPPNFVSSSSP